MQEHISYEKIDDLLDTKTSAPWDSAIDDGFVSLGKRVLEIVVSRRVEHAR